MQDVTSSLSLASKNHKGNSGYPNKSKLTASSLKTGKHTYVRKKRFVKKIFEPLVLSENRKESLDSCIFPRKRRRLRKAYPNVKETPTFSNSNATISFGDDSCSAVSELSAVVHKCQSSNETKESDPCVSQQGSSSNTVDKFSENKIHKLSVQDESKNLANCSDTMKCKDIALFSFDLWYQTFIIRNDM